VILDACGIHDADVLGYSHGGAVAQQLTLDAPDRVSHLILAATTPGLGAPVGDVTALIDTPTNPAWPTPDPVSVAWRVAALASWTSLPYLARITSPTLVVVGEGDRVIPRLTTALFGRGVPNAEVVSIDADHDLQTPEATLLLAPIIERFLSS
jgi:pimeloyl-ACP methyl ester carboxylesterase